MDHAEPPQQHIPLNRSVRGGALVNRRSFFRRLLVHGMDKLEQSARLLGQTLSPDATVPGEGRTQPRWLRPPGALPATDLALTCSGCGHCVEACPAQCIDLDNAVADGLPHIIARNSPCVVCDELACMTACPTGALQLVENIGQIAMGTAVVAFDRCLRQSGTPGSSDRDCRVCVDQCPIGDDALAVGDDDRIEVRPGCIGCGVCEWSCPTQPASIVVESSQSCFG